MNKAVNVLAALTLSVVGAACGDADEVTESTVAMTSTAEVTTTLPTDLGALLLGASDVGEGWTAMTDLSVADLGSMAESPCQDVAVDPTIAARLQPTTGVIFRPSDGSQRGIQELVLTGEPDRVAADLDAVFGSVESCLGVETTTKDGEKLTFERFEIPDMGDQRMATIVVAFEPPDYQTTWRGHTAIVRVGGVVMMLNQFEILLSPDAEPAMGDAEFVGLLQRAVDRLTS